MNPLNFINRSIGVYNIRGFYIEPTYWQAAAIVFLIFLLLLTLGRLRYMYVHWHVSKLSFSFIFYGFVFALILEGFLLLGERTLFTEILGWKNAPKPISTVLEVGRARLVSTLGVTDEIPSSSASESTTYQSVVSDYQGLSSEEMDMVKSFICEP